MKGLMPGVSLGMALLLSSACADKSGQAVAGDCAVSRSSAGSAGGVATASSPATYSLADKAGSVADASAVELTVRPKLADPDAAFLVQVFLSDACVGGGDETAEKNYLGSFSFFPMRVGEIQTFVLPMGTLASTQAGAKDLQLAVKLIPANPARDLGDAAVEVLGARLLK